jgi:hypothetical protein
MSENVNVPVTMHIDSLPFEVIFMVTDMVNIMSPHLPLAQR